VTIRVTNHEDKANTVYASIPSRFGHIKDFFRLNDLQGSDINIWNPVDGIPIAARDTIDVRSRYLVQI
jgi:hypothetical protein